MDTATPWFVVAVAALALLVLVLVVLCATLYLSSRAARAGRRPEGATGTKEAWPDPEKGTEEEAASRRKSPSAKHEPHRPLPLDLCETLRGLLKEEISRALKHEGISERLDRLERKDELSQSLQFASMNDRLERLEKAQLLPPGGLGSPGGSPAAVPWAPQVPQAPQAPPPPPDVPPAVTLRAAASMEESPPQEREPLDCQQPGARREAKHTFGPTARQLRLPDPPETSNFDISEEPALRASLRTLQRNLHSRDAQTTELHRQLRQCQEALWVQTLEARTASKRLRDVLTDPTQVPAAHADELRRLQRELDSISSRLADAKAQWLHWSSIAKRQRAYFMQSDRLGQEGLDLLKRHPAGEVFLVPPPVCLEGDEDDPRNPAWDVGTAHVNPYATDSWPFEPNVLAQKASREPGLTNLEEDEEEAELSSSGSASEGTSPRGVLGGEFGEEEEGWPARRLRLSLPPGGPRPRGAPDEPSPEVEASLPSQTARSF